MKKTSINELMGSAGESGKANGLSLDSLKDLLGDRAPKLEFTPVGRLRLTTALRNRFGNSYRSLPGIEDIIKEFDREAAFNVKLQEMKMIKGKR